MRCTILATFALVLTLAPLADGAEVDLIGQTGGHALDTVVVGDRAYVGSGPTLLVLDVSDPADPALLGQVELPNLAVQIAVSGDYVYVANWMGGLQIIDAADPSAPAAVGSLQTDDLVITIAVANHYAYLLTDGRDFVVVDVSDPASPRSVAELPLSCFVSGRLAVSGDYAYLAARGPGDFGGRLIIIDVSDAQAPFVVSDSHGLGGHDVAVSGSYAYLPTSRGMNVIDVSYAS